MKTIQLTISIILFATLSLLTGCSGSSSTPGNTKTNLKIVFSNASSVIVPTGLKDLGIARLTLDVLPADSASYKTDPIDLYSIYQSTGNMNASIDNLSDNTTYLFRIMGYDANGNYIYGGQTSAKMLPSPAINTINLMNYKFTGFSDLTPLQYFVSATDGTKGSLTFDSSGTGTIGNCTWYLAPTTSGFNVNILDGSGANYTGTLNKSGYGTATGASSSSQEITWTYAPTGTVTAIW